jgi:hypothetical protein
LGAAPVAAPTTPISFSQPDPLDFAVTNNPRVGATLTPGESCNISVVFRPTALGQRTSNLLIQEDVATVNPITIVLSGVGIVRPPTQGYRMVASDAVCSTLDGAVLRFDWWDQAEQAHYRYCR